VTSDVAAVRPPVALGCFGAAAVLVAVFGIILFAVIFLESGADTGRVQLELADAYEPGSVQYINQENFFLVRLRSGDFLALSDLDAANRSNQARRCRVALTSLDDGSLGVTQSVLQTQLSPEANGSNAVFHETCYGSTYDVTGVKLAGDGANLDRLTVSLGSNGHVVVDKSKRHCSQRSGTALLSSTDCAEASRP
jgi:hypothetical protein